MVKGCIELHRIRCVEVIYCDVPIPCNYKYPFQVRFTSPSWIIFMAWGWRQGTCLQCFSLSNVHFFQVFYDNHYLYIFAPDNDCRQKWVRALKEGNCLKQHGSQWSIRVDCSVVCSSTLSFVHSEIKNNNLVTKYHPNFWMDGKWRCCQQSEKLATGCQVYNPLGFGMLPCTFDSSYS